MPLISNAECARLLEAASVSSVCLFDLVRKRCFAQENPRNARLGNEPFVLERAILILGIVILKLGRPVPEPGRALLKSSVALLRSETATLESVASCQ
jgi:hypothetical protein